MSLPIRFARSGKLFVAYTAEGSAPPALVVTPGHFFHLEVAHEWPPFARFIDRLTSFSRVILLDRRGTGLSDGMDPATTLDDAMDDIRAVMDADGVEQAVLMGSAEGGPTCMLFAATFPQRVSALVLVGTFPRRLSAPDYPAGYSPEQHAWVLRVFEERWGRAPVAMRTIPAHVTIHRSSRNAAPCASASSSGRTRRSTRRAWRGWARRRAST